MEEENTPVNTLTMLYLHRANYSDAAVLFTDSDRIVFSGPYFILWYCIWTRGSFVKVFPRLVWGCGTSLIRQLSGRIAESLVSMWLSEPCCQGRGYKSVSRCTAGKNQRKKDPLLRYFFRLQKPSQYPNNSNFPWSASSCRVWGFACTPQLSSQQAAEGKAPHRHWILVS